MALLNRLDESVARDALSKWLARKLPDAGAVRVEDLAIPQGGGMSMTTVLFKAIWLDGGDERQLDLVARVAPSSRAASIFKDPDLAREFRLLQALNEHTDIPVPRVRWLEEDTSVLGSPFMVLDRAYGEIPSDDPPYVVEGWVLELEPERRPALYEGLLSVVARLHAVDWSRLELDFVGYPGFGELGLRQQLGYWEDFYAWAHAGKPSATIDAAFERLRSEAPAGEDLVLNWGDARIGNLIFDPDDLSVQAVLDWETATIASPEMDLGWLVFIVRFYSEGIGVPIPEGLQKRPELISRYEELTGRTVNHVDYYEAFAALRLSILMLRAGQLMIEAGMIPPDNPMAYSNPASKVLAQLLELPAPEGEVSYFVGKR